MRQSVKIAAKKKLCQKILTRTILLRDFLIWIIVSFVEKIGIKIPKLDRVKTIPITDLIDRVEILPIKGVFFAKKGFSRFFAEKDNKYDIFTKKS